MILKRRPALGAVVGASPCMALLSLGDPFRGRQREGPSRRVYQQELQTLTQVWWYEFVCVM